MHVCICLVYAHAYVYIHVYTHNHVPAYTHTHKLKYICIQAHIPLHTHTHTHIYIHAYIQDGREAESIIERVTPRLQHANAAVVLGAVKVVIKLLPLITNVVRITCMYTYVCMYACNSFRSIPCTDKHTRMHYLVVYTQHQRMI